MPAPLGTAASSRLYQPCSAAPQPSKSPQLSIPLSEIAVQLLPPSVLFQMPWSAKLPTLGSPEMYQAYISFFVGWTASSPRKMGQLRVPLAGHAAALSELPPG